MTIDNWCWLQMENGYRDLLLYHFSHGTSQPLADNPEMVRWPNLYCPRWAFSLHTTDQPQWCMSAFMMTNKWNWKPCCKQNSVWIARFLLLLVCFFLDICLHCIQWQRQRSVDDIRHPSAREPLCESKNLNKMSACRLTGIYLRAAWPFTTLKYLS